MVVVVVAVVVVVVVVVVICHVTCSDSLCSLRCWKFHRNRLRRTFRPRSTVDPATEPQCQTFDKLANPE